MLDCYNSLSFLPSYTISPQIVSSPKQVNWVGLGLAVDPRCILYLHLPGRDPVTGRYAVPYPVTRKWNSSSTRTWGCPPLHIDALASLLMPWSAHTFPIRDHVGLPRLLSLPSLSTKASFNPDPVFPVPPSGSDHDFLLFSDGSKSRGRVGAAFVHIHPATGSIIGSHLLPLPSYMSIFDAELYAASCALQYAANCMPRHDAEPPRTPSR